MNFILKRLPTVIFHFSIWHLLCSVCFYLILLFLCKWLQSITWLLNPLQLQEKWQWIWNRFNKQQRNCILSSEINGIRKKELEATQNNDETEILKRIFLVRCNYLRKVSYVSEGSNFKVNGFLKQSRNMF